MLVPLNIAKSLSATMEIVKGAADAEPIDKNPIKKLKKLKKLKKAVRVIFFISAPEVF